MYNYTKVLKAKAMRLGELTVTIHEQLSVENVFFFSSLFLLSVTREIHESTLEKIYSQTAIKKNSEEKEKNNSICLVIFNKEFAKL